MCPPECVEIQMFVKTLSGRCSVSSSNRCTVTPAASRAAAARVTSSNADAARAAGSSPSALGWKPLSARVCGFGAKWCGRTMTTAVGDCTDIRSAHRRERADETEEVLRVVGAGDEVDALLEVGAGDLVAGVAKGREVLDREADRVEERDLLGARAARGSAGQDLPELGHREVGGLRLDLALDAGLGGVLHEDGRAVEDGRVEFRLAGAVATDGIEVHAGADPLVGDDGVPRLVGRAGGH